MLKLANIEETVLFYGKIYTADKNFTRPPVATVATNFKSAWPKSRITIECRFPPQIHKALKMLDDHTKLVWNDDLNEYFSLKDPLTKAAVEQ